MKYLQIALNVPANQTFTYANVEAGKRVAQEEKEQNELIRGGITLTIRTIEFASYLGESLAHMIDDGFRTRDGHFMRLSGQTRELAKNLLAQIEGQKAQLKDSKVQN